MEEMDFKNLYSVLSDNIKMGNKEYVHSLRVAIHELQKIYYPNENEEFYLNPGVEDEIDEIIGW